MPFAPPSRGRSVLILETRVPGRASPPLASARLARLAPARFCPSSSRVAAAGRWASPTSSQRATSDEVEDGVLWVERSAGVVAAEVAGAVGRRARRHPAGRRAAGHRRPARRTARPTCSRCSSMRERGDRHTYTLLRLGSARDGGDARWRRCRAARACSTTCWPRSASSRCWSAPRCARGARSIRRRCTSSGWRSRSSAFTFSFTGRFDRVDWFFYWADVVALLLLPPLFLHFALVFPERPHPPATRRCWRAGCRRSTCRPAVLGLTRIVALVRAGVDPDVLRAPDRAARSRSSCCYLAAFLAAGLAVLVRALGRVALGHGDAPVAVDCVGHGHWRAAVRPRLRDAVRPRRRAVAADGALGASRSASSRWRSPRPSFATA